MLNLANDINEAFLEPQQQFDPLDQSYKVHTADSQVPNISPEETAVLLRCTNISKAGGLDNIPNWILREYSYELALPVSMIINSSIAEESLPTIWKLANVVPLPKKSKTEDITGDLRPISLTPTLSKLAEHFIVHEHVKPAILEKLGSDQFGCIPGSSTTHALVSMFHNWAKATDGTGNDVRVFVMDYKKAFDLIDHKLVMAKLSNNINPYIINRIGDFLSNRNQRVKLTEDCFSEWLHVPSGVPQGTKLGQWLFIVMIDDLHVPSADGLYKYVDDTTTYEVIRKNFASQAQAIVDEITRWFNLNKFELHPKKCKELRISFSRQG
jgi:hypothetical protein